MRHAGKDSIEIYQDEAGGWRWRRFAAGNHEKIAVSGEAFTRESDAVRAAERANRDIDPDLTD